MLFLLHHDCEMTPLLAGRQARWVGIAPQSCSASTEAQPVAWFRITEIKDKGSVTNMGQSAELCPIPALLQLQKATLGKSAPPQLHFPGQPLSCVLTLWQRFVKCFGLLAGQRFIADGIEEDACVREGGNLKAF